MKPINAVMVVADDDEKNESVSELFSQGNATLKNRKKSVECRNKVFCLESTKRSISQIKEELTIPGSILYVVGHHEEFGRIGLCGFRGLNPEELGDKIAKLLGDSILRIKEIHFYVCNSAYHEEDKMLSYCGRFWNYLQNKYNSSELVVAGFVGYIWEDVKHKRTYVSQTYGDYTKKIRAEEKIVYFKNS